jgi:hypothetical protein
MQRRFEAPRAPAPLRGTLRRYVFGAVLVLAILLVALSTLAVRQVATDGLAFVDSRRALLEERVDGARSTLRTLERAALDAIERTLGGAPAGRDP